MLSYLEISKGAITHNIKQFKTLINGDTCITAVIKANAYGHGQNIVAQVIEAHVDYFQVDSIEELRKLRQITSKPVLVLGYVDNDDLEELVKLDGTPTVYDVERVEKLNLIGEAYHKKIAIHIKIDAQLGRLGIVPRMCGEFAGKMSRFKNIDIQGIYMHFANLEDTKDTTHANKQLLIFRKCINTFSKWGINPKTKHTAATSGILVHQNIENEYNMVRLGIGMYGLWPSDSLRKRYEGIIALTPVLKWVTHAAQVKTLPRGHNVGYGLTYTTTKSTKIAIVPQGYSDGYDRGLSNRGNVLIRGERAPVIGRVAMNMFAVDVSKIRGVTTSDEVVLLGQQNSVTITAEEIANELKTINYEVVSRINPLLPRKLVE